uniref:NADH dehydrogenase I subunit L n=1 Tax=uncultured prokaryote TaxID=198431 RepID=H5SP92_9ZZZZ|nr:NADH dehydrogenase I subunit L [uncultured prokaryote]
MVKLTIPVLILPLFAFAIQIFFGKRLPRKGDWVSNSAIFLSLFISLYIFYGMWIRHDPHYRESIVFDWIVMEGLRIRPGIILDNLTAVMLIVVCVVSSLVHLYSIGYMHGDKRYSRFFAFLSLFSFSMLGLVLSDNLFCLYIFWELVGLSSYLLIGFWFERPAAADACKKAFITTRIGDIGMFMGIMLIFSKTGLLRYEEIFEAVRSGELSGFYLTLAGTLIFMGAVGKSAQMPLHVWLPDAMEGPTPVSALIHAATMVAAGVYMVGRLYPIFTHESLLTIAYIGGITAFVAATIGIVQNDIKRVLAYSTISQLGYMMLALGVGGWLAGLFHLTTHAFFKALLFLGSGSVIHAMHTNDIQEMGGLRKKMPITFYTFLAGTLAISGVPFFSGYYSKDAIIASVIAFVQENPSHLLLAILSVGAAGVTAFYMFRLVYVTFTGEPRDHERYHHAHESPSVMTVPLIILAILSVVSGWGGWFESFMGSEELHHTNHEVSHRLAVILSVSVSAIGIVLSTLTYYTGHINADRMAEKFRSLYRLLYNKYYFDEIYYEVIIKPVLWVTRFLRSFDLVIIDGIVDGSAKLTVIVSRIERWIDDNIVDGAVNGTADAIINMGKLPNRMQTGVLQNYLLAAFAGVLLILIWRII